MSESLLGLAAQISQELEFTKLTGLWANGELVSEKSPWQAQLEGAQRQRARNRRRTKLETQQARAYLLAEQQRLEQERELALKRAKRTRDRAQRMLLGSAESKRKRWRQQKG
eukprot:5820799-Amphidinium_carterae.1